MANIEIQQANKRFGSSTILHDISIDVRDGEFLVLVGPSGCGKSTLLRLIAGLEGFSSGRLLISGRNVTDLPPKDRDIAMVFQNYALYPHMTVERNMGFSLEIAHVDKETRKQSVRAAAEVLGLTPLLGRYPRQLSGGQRQRVAMGRAIVRQPTVFLFDEPLSNLDAQLRVEMRAEIKRLHQRLGATIIYVTHDQVEAMTMADRIAVMNRGRVEQLGTPMELYDRPANTFVAKFIGSPSMNMIPGRITASHAGSMTFVSAEADGFAIEGGAAKGEVDREILAGVRPEDFILSDTGLSVRVTLVEPMGSETQILCMHGTSQLVVTLRGREQIKQGDTIKIEPRLRHIHYFDQKTGVAIGNLVVDCYSSPRTS